MVIKKTIFKNLVEIKFKKYIDSRGSFVKIFNKSNSKKFKNECYESYISISKKGSFRGMHSQVGRYAQDKLIYCAKGKILDIAVDLRKKSKTYGKVFKKTINSKIPIAILIPKGFIHGIIALENQTVVVTYCSKPYNLKKEFGIRPDSIPFSKPKIKLIISKKDKKLQTFNEFMKK